MLVVFFVGFSQTPLADLGIQVSGGRLYSSSSLVDPNPESLYRTDLFSMANLGFFLEKRIKTIGISLASGYSYQRMRFEDPNAEYFSSGSQQLFYTSKSSSVFLNVGIAKFLSLNDRLSGYGKLGFQSQFYSGNLASSETDMKTLLGDIPVTTTLKTNPFSFGICPEIGIQLRKNKHAWTFFLQQNVGLLASAEGNTSRNVLGTDVDQSEFSSKNSFSTFGVRYTISINKKEKSTELAIAKEKEKKEKRPKKIKDSTIAEEKKLTYDSTGLPKTLDERIIEKQNEVVVHSTEIEFFVWDDKQEDKDSISLYINGQWVLQEFEITKKKKSVKVTIDPQRDNFLIMYALNEGKYPPNTCAISIDDGSGEKRIYLKSSMKSCGALQFRYKPKD
jgi:hypothetical protein